MRGHSVGAFGGSLVGCVESLPSVPTSGLLFPDHVKAHFDIVPREPHGTLWIAPGKRHR